MAQYVPFLKQEPGRSFRDLNGVDLLSMLLVFMDPHVAHVGNCTAGECGGGLALWPRGRERVLARRDGDSPTKVLNRGEGWAG